MCKTEKPKSDYQTSLLIEKPIPSIRCHENVIMASIFRLMEYKQMSLSLPQTELKDNCFKN